LCFILFISFFSFTFFLSACLFVSETDRSLKSRPIAFSIARFETLFARSWLVCVSKAFFAWLGRVAWSNRDFTRKHFFVWYWFLVVAETHGSQLNRDCIIPRLGRCSIVLDLIWLTLNTSNIHNTFVFEFMATVSDMLWMFEIWFVCFYTWVVFCLVLVVCWWLLVVGVRGCSR